MIAPARRVAYRILNQIATADARSDELLHTPEVDALSPQDRNLATTLVLGVLRWQLALDVQIRALLARPDAKLSADVAIALRLGAFQVLHLDRVPAHAVLNDSVELVKQTPDHGASGMVNAILRRIAAQGKFVPPTALRSAREVAEAWAHPVWMVERWARRYGVEAAAAICRWDQEPPGVTLRLDSAVAELPGMELEPGAFLAQARRVAGGDLRGQGAFEEGRVRIQDEASQLVAEIAATSSPQAARVLDACAAPGGKTAILAERLPAAEITALDVSRKRLDAMRRNFPRAHAGRVRFAADDAARLQMQAHYDLILCDVPCSGTGTLARNPEIRLRLDEADLRRQSARQTAILRAALPGLKPGGRLLYSTCSLEREENEEVVEGVLRDQPGFRLLPVGGLIEQLAGTGIVTPAGRKLPHDIVDGNFLRIIPGLHPCDGFFAAVLQRD